MKGVEREVRVVSRLAAPRESSTLSQPTSRQDATEERERERKELRLLLTQKVVVGIVVREEKEDGRTPTLSTGLLCRGSGAIVLLSRGEETRVCPAAN